MSFIEARDGHTYAVDRIVRIGPEVIRGGGWVRDAEVEGIGTVTFFGHRIEMLLRESVSVFAAQPETLILRFDEADGTMWRVPVIGWSVSRDMEVYPISPGGVNDADDDQTDHPVLTPDGRVTQRNGGNWDDLDSFLRSRATGVSSIAA